jgi:hypothetical protein
MFTAFTAAAVKEPGNGLVEWVRQNQFFPLARPDPNQKAKMLSKAELQSAADDFDARQAKRQSNDEALGKVSDAAFRSAYQQMMVSTNGDPSTREMAQRMRDVIELLTPRPANPGGPAPTPRYVIKTVDAGTQSVHGGIGRNAAAGLGACVYYGQNLNEYLKFLDNQRRDPSLKPDRKLSLNDPFPAFPDAATTKLVVGELFMQGSSSDRFLLEFIPAGGSAIQAPLFDGPWACMKIRYLPGAKQDANDAKSWFVPIQVVAPTGQNAGVTVVLRFTFDKPLPAP